MVAIWVAFGPAVSVLVFRSDGAGLAENETGIAGRRSVLYLSLWVSVALLLTKNEFLRPWLRLYLALWFLIVRLFGG